jgi:hypothetical protein
MPTGSESLSTRARVRPELARAVSVVTQTFSCAKQKPELSSLRWRSRPPICARVAVGGIKEQDSHCLLERKTTRAARIQPKIETWIFLFESAVTH